MKLKELAQRIGNLKTTIVGIVTLLVSVLVGLNVIGPEAGTELSTGIDLLYSKMKYRHLEPVQLIFLHDRFY